MPTVNEGYIVDEGGNRIGVIVPMSDYLRLTAELEELESIRVYDEAKQSGDEAVPFNQAVREIEQDRL
jgi:hypothetical protein